MDEHNENFNKERETIRKYQREVTKLKNTITEMKNTIKVFNRDQMKQEKGSANSKTRKWNSPKQSRKKGKRKKKREDSLRDLWDNIKQSNICITELLEGEKRKKGEENLFEEIMAEKFPNLGKETDSQIQEAQRISNKGNQKRPTPRHIIVKMSKVKDKREY